MIQIHWVKILQTIGEFKLSFHFTTLGKEKQIMKLKCFGDNSHTKHYIITRYNATNWIKW